MIETRVLERDPLTGTTEYFHYDDVTDEFTIETVADVEPLVELNKALFNNTEKHTRHGEMTRIASIPLDLYFQEKKKGTWADQAAFRRFVNDPDNRVFRVRAGTY